MGIPCVSTWNTLNNLNRIRFIATLAAGQLVKNYSGLTRNSTLVLSKISNIQSQSQSGLFRMFSQCCTKTPTIPSITGNLQSPVNIISGETVKDEELSNSAFSFTEGASIFTLKNTGSSMNAEPGSDKTYQVAGGPLKDPYSLVGFHFHWVKDGEYWSEHTVDNVAYSGELHLVHLNKLKYKSVEEALNYPDGLCVLGVFLKSDDADHKELGMLTQHFKDIKFKCATSIMKEPFSPYSLLPSDRKSYWTYPGSLTTPPYSECVTWVVFKDAIHVSPAQMLEFRGLKPATADDAKECEKNQKPLPETTTNARDTYPIVKRKVKATF